MKKPNIDYCEDSEIDDLKFVGGVRRFDFIDNDCAPQENTISNNLKEYGLSNTETTKYFEKCAGNTVETAENNDFLRYIRDKIKVNILFTNFLGQKMGRSLFEKYDDGLLNMANIRWDFIDFEKLNDDEKFSLASVLLSVNDLHHKNLVCKYSDGKLDIAVVDYDSSLENYQDVDGNINRFLTSVFTPVGVNPDQFNTLYRKDGGNGRIIDTGIEKSVRGLYNYIKDNKDRIRDFIKGFDNQNKNTVIGSFNNFITHYEEIFDKYIDTKKEKGSDVKTVDLLTLSQISKIVDTTL